MSCLTCLLTKPIPLCISAIAIGEIPDINTDVVVKIKSEATGRITLISATSDGSGIVTVDVSAIEFMEQDYTFSIHKPNEYSNEYDISIGSEQSKCITVIFEHCNENVDEVTLEMAE